MILLLREVVRVILSILKKRPLAIARRILGKDAGRSLLSQLAPRFLKLAIQESAAIVQWSHVGNGLTLAKGQTVLKGFAIAGEDRKFVPARAEIIAPDKVKLSSEKVPKPVATLISHNVFLGLVKEFCAGR